ncbi:MAG TPA: pyridoxal phosphate-dependent aminotransferase [Kineosporiaceae bacterium]|nr:pyridoxal phosphate-dependent aminotransferase [Kineosporiaceae bacterium]
MEIRQSRKLTHVAYDVRGPVLEEAMRLEAEGHRILRLNIGNPAPFGFEAPDDILSDMIHQLPAAHGYSDAKGILPARRAVVQYHRRKGVTGIDVEDVWLGNGVSELISMTLQGLLNDGDEVLIPAPDYPLWTAVATLAGGRPVHYLCDEASGWLPDLADLEAKITPRTVALVVINPNNPTGAVYPREVLEGLAEIARRHQLVLFSDEIYDQILYDGAEHIATAAVAPDVLCVTFNGLSKAYRVAGFRAGWAVVSGPKQHAASYLEGLTILANMRLCANVPAQHAIATALGDGPRSIADLVLPGGRLCLQRDRTWELLQQIEGVSCVKPTGAVYCFPRLDPAIHPIEDDERFVLELLRDQHVLVVHGRGFNWPRSDHFRIVTLPHLEDLNDAVGRIGGFLDRRRAETAGIRPPVDRV